MSQRSPSSVTSFSSHSPSFHPPSTDSSLPPPPPSESHLDYRSWSSSAGAAATEGNLDTMEVEGRGATEPSTSLCSNCPHEIPSPDRRNRNAQRLLGGTVKGGGSSAEELLEHEGRYTGRYSYSRNDEQGEETLPYRFYYEEAAGTPSRQNSKEGGSPIRTAGTMTASKSSPLGCGSDGAEWRSASSSPSPSFSPTTANPSRATSIPSSEISPSSISSSPYSSRRLSISSTQSLVSAAAVIPGQQLRHPSEVPPPLSGATTTSSILTVSPSHQTRQISIYVTTPQLSSPSHNFYASTQIAATSTISSSAPAVTCYHSDNNLADSALPTVTTSSSSPPPPSRPIAQASSSIRGFFRPVIFRMSSHSATSTTRSQRYLSDFQTHPSGQAVLASSRSTSPAIPNGNASTVTAGGINGGCRACVATHMPANDGCAAGPARSCLTFASRFRSASASMSVAAAWGRARSGSCCGGGSNRNSGSSGSSSSSSNSSSGSSSGGGSNSNSSGSADRQHVEEGGNDREETAAGDGSTYSRVTAEASAAGVGSSATTLPHAVSPTVIAH